MRHDQLFILLEGAGRGRFTAEAILVPVAILHGSTEQQQCFANAQQTHEVLIEYFDYHLDVK